MKTIIYFSQSPVVDIKKPATSAFSFCFIENVSRGKAVCLPAPLRKCSNISVCTRSPKGGDASMCDGLICV